MNIVFAVGNLVLKKTLICLTTKFSYYQIDLVINVGIKVVTIHICHDPIRFDSLTSRFNKSDSNQMNALLL